MAPPPASDTAVAGCPLFTDALKDDDHALVDAGRRWRERRDGTA